MLRSAISTSQSLSKSAPTKEAQALDVAAPQNPPVSAYVPPLSVPASGCPSVPVSSNPPPVEVFPPPSIVDQSMLKAPNAKPATTHGAITAKAIRVLMACLLFQPVRSLGPTLFRRFFQIFECRNPRDIGDPLALPEKR